MLKRENRAIEDLVKQIRLSLESYEKEAESIDVSRLNTLIIKINDMIFKEEEIMIPMMVNTFSQEDWAQIARNSSGIGYTLITEVKQWVPEHVDADNNTPIPSPKSISLDGGSLTQEEINAILNTVPVDMTFVGSDNCVKYFTQGKDRIFHRSMSIIGREVKNCHPPKSVHIVEQIVEDLRNGVKDHEDFWIRMNDMFVYIRYFAVRNMSGEFLGVLEVSQDIKPITELKGEKRLRDKA
ncbi:MAG: PAS domain-containing protein [Lachnospiraceae bacterium]